VDTESEIRLKRARRADGLASLTTWRILRRFPSHTLVMAAPVTGRQHQIRVHFAGIGHPVVGDLLYKDERLFQRARGGEPSAEGVPTRHFLHASRIRFHHPVTAAVVLIESPLPEDFRALITALAGDAERPPRG
jgi:23S rRNA-/tRNA-specific pseudouridylate synthase